MAGRSCRMASSSNFVMMVVSSTTLMAGCEFFCKIFLWHGLTSLMTAWQKFGGPPSSFRSLVIIYWHLKISCRDFHKSHFQGHQDQTQGLMWEQSYQNKSCWVWKYKPNKPKMSALACLVFILGLFFLENPLKKTCSHGPEPHLAKVIYLQDRKRYDKMVLKLCTQGIWL